MSENSKIEWCDHTFNPWIGCTKVSPGCANCYAANSTRARVLRAGGHETWGKGAPRSRTQTWGDPVKWNRQAEGAEHRPRVFCASLADWLDDEVPIEWLADLVALIWSTPNLDWLLLTKRPENWKQRIGMAARHTRESGGDMTPYCSWGHGIVLHNVWIGATVENQEMALKRIPQLLEIPSVVRFLSCEPLLGPVKLLQIPFAYPDEDEDEDTGLYFPLAGEVLGRRGPVPLKGGGIHWVIAGGESGPKARPMHPDWARSLRDQCQAAGVPFLFKQWGEWCPATEDFGVSGSVMPETGEKFSWIGWDGKTKNPSFQGLQEPIMAIAKQGKKRAGRLLDGREWNEFPTTSQS